MRRRTVIGGLIGGVMAGSGKWMSAAMAEGETVNIETAHYAGVGEKWTGAQALAGGKGYAQCRLGALHYRHLCAPSREELKPTILLLHQTPFGLEVFSDGGSFSLMLDPRKWAERVSEFVSTI